ncbi:MAG: hypothetical protein WAO35_28940 [Terriglobia bacterium]
MRSRGKYRHKYWVRAAIVGVLLAGEIHLFFAEILHHHDEVARVCQMEHRGGTYLHPAQDLNPLCPLCQIVRSGSVRPAVQTLVQKPQRVSAYLPITRLARYSPSFTISLLARAPPLFS